jgi:hypothetical protein
MVPIKQARSSQGKTTEPARLFGYPDAIARELPELTVR